MRKTKPRLTRCDGSAPRRTHPAPVSHPVDNSSGRALRQAATHRHRTAPSSKAEGRAWRGRSVVTAHIRAVVVGVGVHRPRIDKNATLVIPSRGHALRLSGPQVRLPFSTHDQPESFSSMRPSALSSPTSAA